MILSVIRGFLGANMRPSVPSRLAPCQDATERTTNFMGENEGDSTSVVLVNAAFVQGGGEGTYYKYY